MPRFIIEATRIHNYEVEVEAEDELSAHAQLDDWIADDFEDFEVGASWEFNAIEIEKENN